MRIRMPTRFDPLWLQRKYSFMFAAVLAAILLIVNLTQAKGGFVEGGAVVVQEGLAFLVGKGDTGRHGLASWLFGGSTPTTIRPSLCHLQSQQLHKDGTRIRFPLCVELSRGNARVLHRGSGGAQIYTREHTGDILLGVSR